jgi:hypothetical protein
LSSLRRELKSISTFAVVFDISVPLTSLKIRDLTGLYLLFERGSVWISQLTPSFKTI